MRNLSYDVKNNQGPASLKIPIGYVWLDGKVHDNPQPCGNKWIKPEQPHIRSG